MNVYFTASVVGKQYHLAKYQAIVETVSKKHHTVTADHIMNGSEDHIRLETKAQREAFHKKLNQWISGCDCMVVEASFPSISVGFEISLALHWNKPILVLYSEGDPPSLLASYREDLIVCEEYSLENLSDVLNGFLSYVQGHGDTRFTFFLPSQLAAYLEEVAQESHYHKATYLRKLLEEDRQKQL